MEDLALAFCGASDFGGVIAAGVCICVGICIRIRIAVALGGIGVTAVVQGVVAIVVIVAAIPL